MATISNPCRPPVGFGDSGLSISRTSYLRFNVKCGYSVSPTTSPLGELFAGDGGVNSRVILPRRTLGLGALQLWSTSTSRRSLAILGRSTLKALVDETRTTSTGEKYALSSQEDEELLQAKAALVVQQLAGTCIYLVGMMGSGKSTVGRGVSEALGYFFFDSDKLVEEAGGITIAEMFGSGREEEFRNAETDVLQQLSSMSRLVVATGGGAVIRPQNWGYMRQGVTVWLDVPLDCLARRVVAVGCHSRPLLRVSTEDAAYKQALGRLTVILHERREMYKNADVVVSVQGIAREKGVDIETITPTMIAVQVLEEISRMFGRGGGFNR